MNLDAHSHETYALLSLSDRVTVVDGYTTIDVESDERLQVNPCAGDAASASLTVPALVQANCRLARRPAVVDCCRP